MRKGADMENAKMLRFQAGDCCYAEGTNGSKQTENRIPIRKSGRFAPLAAAAAMILWAAVSQSNVNGYVLAFLQHL